MKTRVWIAWLIHTQAILGLTIVAIYRQEGPYLTLILLLAAQGMLLGSAGLSSVRESLSPLIEGVSWLVTLFCCFVADSQALCFYVAGQTILFLLLGFCLEYFTEKRLQQQVVRELESQKQNKPSGEIALEWHEPPSRPAPSEPLETPEPPQPPPIVMFSNGYEDPTVIPTRDKE